MADDIQVSAFETIKHTDEDDTEYWSARELASCSAIPSGATSLR